MQPAALFAEESEVRWPAIEFGEGVVELRKHFLRITGCR
jgi:hypothetical protein